MGIICLLQPVPSSAFLNSSSNDVAEKQDKLNRSFKHPASFSSLEAARPHQLLIVCFLIVCFFPTPFSYACKGLGL